MHPSSDQSPFHAFVTAVTESPALDTKRHSIAKVHITAAQLWDLAILAGDRSSRGRGGQALPHDSQVDSRRHILAR